MSAGEASGIGLGAFSESALRFGKSLDTRQSVISAIMRRKRQTMHRRKYLATHNSAMSRAKANAGVRIAKMAAPTTAIISIVGLYLFSHALH